MIKRNLPKNCNNKLNNNRLKTKLRKTLKTLKMQDWNKLPENKNKQEYSQNNRL